MNIYLHIYRRLLVYLVGILLFSLGNSSYAQKQSLGLHFGITSYTGDLKPSYTGDLKPGNLIIDYSKPSGGLFYRYGLSDAVSLRLHLLGGSITGSDKDAPDILGQFRNLEFNITYAEVSAIFEYYFLNPKNAYGKKIPSPYVFLGAGALTFSSYQDPATDYSTIQPVVPFGLGLKVPVGRVSYLDFNFGTRKTFFDYLDNISIESVEEKDFLYGDQYSTDWYHYFSISFSYLIQSLKCPVPLSEQTRYDY